MKRTVICRYDRDGQLMAVGDSKTDLARQLGITVSAICDAMRRGSKSYALVEIDGDEEDE